MTKSLFKSVNEEAFVLWAILTALVASLLPYPAAGFRIDHITSLFLGLYGVSNLSALFFSKESRSVFISAGILFFAALICGFNSIFFHDLTFMDIVKPIGRLMMPVMQMIGFAALLLKVKTLDPRKITNSLIVIGVVSALITFLSLWWLPTILVDHITAFNPRSLWHETRSLGRYTGLFIQPLEAGIFFAVACIVALIAYSKSLVTKTTFWVSITILIIAGNLSLSKNFYFVGFLSILYLSFCLKGDAQRSLFLIVPIHIMSFLVVLMNASPVYYNSLVILFQKTGILGLISGGRFKLELKPDGFNLNSIGDGSSGWHYFQQMLDSNLHWIGYGLGKASILDNGYFEYALAGGLVPMLLYFSVVVLMLIHSCSLKDNKDRFSLHAMLIFVLISSIGGPVFTANRAGTFFVFLTVWLMLKPLRTKTN